MESEDGEPEHGGGEGDSPSFDYSAKKTGNESQCAWANRCSVEQLNRLIVGRLRAASTTYRQLIVGFGPDLPGLGSALEKKNR